jgi:hypothetical protein
MSIICHESFLADPKKYLSYFFLSKLPLISLGIVYAVYPIRPSIKANQPKGWDAKPPACVFWFFPGNMAAGLPAGSDKNLHITPRHRFLKMLTSGDTTCQ